MTSENIDTISWDILDKLFNKCGSSESCNHLVKHQIESYNKFLDTTLSHIITGFNPIKINSNNPKMKASGFDTGKLGPSSLFYLPCKGLDAKAAFFRDFKEGRKLLPQLWWLGIC